MAALSAAASASIVVCKASRSAAVQPAFAPCSGLKSAKGLPRLHARSQTVEEGFAKLAVSCRAQKGSGGALASRADIASEVFGIVPVMFGMVLTGIALGFVLIRMENIVEESEQ